MDMKIKSVKTNSIEKQIEVVILYRDKKILFNVSTINGKVMGDANKGISTAYLSYFDKYSEKIRQKHFEQIKKYVESHIK